MGHVLVDGSSFGGRLLRTAAFTGDGIIDLRARSWQLGSYFAEILSILTFGFTPVSKTNRQYACEHSQLGISIL